MGNGAKGRIGGDCAKSKGGGDLGILNELQALSNTSPMICTALDVAFLVYPTVLALMDAIVRPQPVPAAPMRESSRRETVSECPYSRALRRNSSQPKRSRP